MPGYFHKEDGFINDKIFNDLLTPTLIVSKSYDYLYSRLNTTFVKDKFMIQDFIPDKDLIQQ